MVEFDRKFSVGNIWTIGVVLAGLVAGWAQFGNNIETNARDIKAVEARVTSMENNFRALLDQLSAKEVVQTRILTELQTDMKYVRGALGKQ